MTSLSVENGSACLASRIAEAVQTATGGRVQGLQVVANDNRVLLRGLSPSYAVKKAAQDITLLLAGDANLTNEIVVWYPDSPTAAAPPLSGKEKPPGGSGQTADFSSHQEARLAKGGSY